MPRIVRFYNIGGPEVLQLEEAGLETPGPGEVRLKVEAFGLNRAEVLFRQGLYLERPKTPSRIGYEAAGVVDAVGPEVSGVKVGDRVGTIPGFSMRKYGVYGESAIVPANIVAPYPANLSPVEGAAIWMQYMTAYGALVALGHLTKGDFVLITAASSSVGLAAIQITKWLGATAIATTRGAAKQQALIQAGADHVIVTDTEDLPRRVKEITDGRGAHLIFDSVAGPFIEKLAKSASFGGVIFEYGSLALAPTPFPLAEAMGKGLSVRGYTLFEISGQPEKLARGKQFVYDGLKAGALKPVIAKTFPIEAVADAHRYMESNTQVGKIVVTV
jgi:NADPH:quinone reductase-like Zn-dependent oxidoreductase